jgi:hypothetical protein
MCARVYVSNNVIFESERGNTAPAVQIFENSKNDAIEQPAHYPSSTDDSMHPLRRSLMLFRLNFFLTRTVVYNRERLSTSPHLTFTNKLHFRLRPRNPKLCRLSLCNLNLRRLNLSL